MDLLVQLLVGLSELNDLSLECIDLVPKVDLFV